MIDIAEWPDAPSPLGAYSACFVRDGYGTISGQMPIVDGVMQYTGTIGDDVSRPQADQAVSVAARNCIAQLAKYLHDTNRTLVGLSHLSGYLRTTTDFTEHAELMDVSSDMFIDVLGTTIGAHTRSVVGVASLPASACVELVLNFHVR